jgi:hypothetical protein
MLENKLPECWGFGYRSYLMSSVALLLFLMKYTAARLYTNDRTGHVGVKCRINLFHPPKVICPNMFKLISKQLTEKIPTLNSPFYLPPANPTRLLL